MVTNAAAASRAESRLSEEQVARVSATHFYCNVSRASLLDIGSCWVRGRFREHHSQARRQLGSEQSKARSPCLSCFLILNSATWLLLPFSPLECVSFGFSHYFFFQVTFQPKVSFKVGKKQNKTLLRSDLNTKHSVSRTKRLSEILKLLDHGTLFLSRKSPIDKRNKTKQKTSAVCA